MRVVFIGCVEFSYKSLQKLIDMKVGIVGVCTKESSSMNSDFHDLSPLCINNAIPVKYIKDINSIESIDWISNLSPDIVFCFGWSSLIKKELLSLPEMGVVGFHPTELPKNRGRHPLIWALVLGLNESASTFFFMEKGADDGDILSQEKFDISYKDNAESLYSKVTSLALKQIEEFIPKLALNSYIRQPQDDALSNVWRKRSKSDGVIDFRMSSAGIYNLVRGLTKPYVGAHIEYEGEDISVWEVEEVVPSRANIEFGRVLAVKDNTFTVKCLDKAVRILKHDFKVLPSVGEYL